MTTVVGPDGRPPHSPARQPEVAWVESVWRQVRDAGAALFEKENLAVRPKEIPFPSGRPLDRAWDGHPSKGARDRPNDRPTSP